MSRWIWSRVCLVFCIVLLPVYGFCSGGYRVNVQMDNTDILLTFTIEDYSISNFRDGRNTYAVIEFPGGVKTTRKGFAELPFVHASISLPPNGNPVLEVISSGYTDIALDHPMRPSKGIIYRDQDPQSIDYRIAEESMQKHWYPEMLAESSEPFVFRDVRGTNVYVNPFRYNAQENLLRVYKNIQVRVHVDPSETVNALTRSGKKNLPVMHAIYDSVFLNYTAERVSDIGEAGDILLICTARDADAVAPFAQWKREKGFTVHMRVVDPGTNVKRIIGEEYKRHPNILYVQLIGDWDDIRSDLGTRQNAPMDPMLGCVKGDDDYPDLIVGRFSANSAEQVAVQIKKAIDYEKSPQLNASWYQSGLGIGSAEGEGAGDDGEADYEHIDVIKRYKLEPYTFQSVEEIYQEGSTYSVESAVNDGTGIINYCGHGSITSWGTTGFSTSEIASLSNSERLPVIVSVACLNGAFHIAQDCFAEAWLRKENGGAVAAIMSTINQPWMPPMRGQDYINDLLTGGYDYEHNPGNGTSSIEGRSTLGSIVLNSMVLMYAESSGDDDLETLQSWTLFGDASLQVRTDRPLPIEVSNQVVTAGSPFSTTIVSDQGGVPGAVVTLQQDGNVFSAITDESGTVSIEHQLVQGSATLVVSGSNLETKYHPISVACVFCASSGEKQYLKYIKQVRLGSFVNKSKSAAYSDFTLQEIGLEPGTVTDVELAPGNGMFAFLGNWRIWIDLNQDGDFDDVGEMVFQGSGRWDITGKIRVPQDTPSGTTRMRVSMGVGTFAPSCGEFVYGEVEDYAVTISQAGF